MGLTSSTPTISKEKYNKDIYNLKRHVKHLREINARNNEKINNLKSEYTTYAFIGGAACIALVGASYFAFGKRLRIKNTELKLQLKRVQEEALHIKTRADKDVAISKKYGHAKLAKSLLIVSDNLDHAVDPKFNIEDNNEANMNNIKDGIQITRDNLQKILLEHGIEKINPLGEVFNPTLGHEAVQTIESKKANYPSDHVNEVLQCGFRLYDRDLRAASVIVVKD